MTWENSRARHGDVLVPSPPGDMQHFAASALSVQMFKRQAEKHLWAVEHNLESERLCGGKWRGKATPCREDKTPQGRGWNSCVGKAWIPGRD